MKEQKYKTTGTVSGQELNVFYVETEEFGQISCHIGGKARKRRIVIGDTVEIEISMYDPDKGIIKRRL